MMLTKANIVVRRGHPEDAPDFANLALLSGPTLFPAIFGSGVKGVMQNLFRQRRNLFSFEHSYFIEVDDTKAGMILGYDWKTQRGEEWRTGLLLIKFMKLGFFARIPVLLKALSLVGRAEDNEYYISNVAVYPEFGGANLGANLLLKMEEEAKSSGARKVVLDVDVDNEGAIRLYNRLGYLVAGKPMRAKINGESFAFFRMRKNCDDNVA
ncbi:MAG: GNAT family N-acetyltransferase [Chloroflexi bacterium]|nr:GNAT family N-acetyltransferase [Chloroflexota bacterium]